MPPSAVWARLQSLGRPDWFLEFNRSSSSNQKLLTIGRNPASTLCLTDNMTVSNRHVSFEQRISDVTGRRSIILHESSSNGTWINGTQYSKGQELELTNGAEISFPCEDNIVNERKRDFTFIFEILDDSEEGDGGESFASRSNKNEPSAEWLLLQEQCDDLAKEAARMAASVFVNSEKVKELSQTLHINGEHISFVDPLEEATRGMLQALKMAEEKLLELGDEKSAKLLDIYHWESTLVSLGVVQQHQKQQQQQGEES